MNELVTYPSGGAGKNAVSDVTEWTEGVAVVVLNGVGGRTEDRPYLLKSLVVESISVDGTYEIVFYAGEGESEERIFSQKFGATLLPFAFPIYCKRQFPGGTQIKAKLMDSNGSGSVFFSVQYEADPGNVRAS
jgi:hypothetical protein